MSLQAEASAQLMHAAAAAQSLIAATTAEAQSGLAEAQRLLAATAVDTNATASRLRAQGEANVATAQSDVAYTAKAMAKTAADRVAMGEAQSAKRQSEVDGKTSRFDADEQARLSEWLDAVRPQVEQILATLRDLRLQKIHRILDKLMIVANCGPRGYTDRLNCTLRSDTSSFPPRRRFRSLRETVVAHRTVALRLSPMPSPLRWFHVRECL